MNLPTIPQTFTGTEPSLNDLIDWSKNIGKYNLPKKNTDCLHKYRNDAEESKWSNGKYYLYGHIPIDCDTPITHDLLQSAIEKHNISMIDYIPYNSMEAASNATHQVKFTNLLQGLDIYYNHSGLLDTFTNMVMYYIKYFGLKYK